MNGSRVIANRGGTRSGKTYSIMSLFVAMIYATNKPRVIDVVSESLPHLKRGALKDLGDILDNEGLVDGEHYTHNKTDNIYTFLSGLVIRFYSVDATNSSSWHKVKGARRDILFINECNHIPYEVYRQLAIRTTECIFLDWNPDAEFWYDEKIMNKAGTVEIHSTYLDNPFLPQEQIDEIESNKDDPNWWNVYGLGLTGRPVGLIYTRWEIVSDVPDEAVLVAHGVDFGFTNDPTAIVYVYKLNGELYLDERCYRRGMTNDRIADELRGLTGKTVADSAEMKSITEIHNFGVRFIEPAQKGPDSVRAGIQILQRYKMNVTSRSLNLIYELRNYKWEEDRITGEILNVPIDKFNHCLDAVRYVALNCLSERPIIRRPRAKIGEI